MQAAQTNILPKDPNSHACPQINIDAFSKSVKKQSCQCAVS